MSIQNVTIIGMGALGTMFGTEIQTKLGQDHVSFLMDKERFEKNSQKTYLVNGTPAGFRLITPDMASPADLIIVSTKATGLISALDTMERSVGPNTIIISAINGVRSEDILIDRFGGGHVIHAVAQGMDATFFDYELTFFANPAPSASESSILPCRRNSMSSLPFSTRSVSLTP